jgi:iron complex outermembrane receptor protein
VGKGHENTYNIFAQLKHRWKCFILNAGLRYDHKHHFDNTDINEFSPRIALILLQPKWAAKFSYSKSFVDAPYLYRKYDLFVSQLTADVTPGSTQPSAYSELQSEYMHSLQLTLSGTNWFNGFYVELNTFYNRAKNLIYQSITNYTNAGTNKTIGTELTTRYDTKRLNTYLTVCWQRVIQAEIYQRNIDKAYNVPDVTINAVVAYKVLKNLKVHGHLAFEGKQTAFTIDLQQEKLRLIEKELNPRAIFSMGADLRIKQLELGFNIHNLFNTKIERGGLGTSLVPQKGTWFMFSAAYNIK